MRNLYFHFKDVNKDNTDRETNEFDEENGGVSTNERLGKRLTYLLRYGALKAGLQVSTNGM